jgi:UDP-N-acetylglucosamine 4-epimerase
MKKIENSKVLVTGGAGFIGTHLCEALLAQDNEVICLDNFSTGKWENVERFLNVPNFRLISGDIRKRKTCESAMKGVDYVLHHAALGSVPRSIKDPATTTEVNVSGFVNVLFAAHKAGVKRVVYATSSSVYGDDPHLPKIEAQTGSPLSPYAVTKQANELFAANFSRVYGLETIGLRYFNVFGPRQDPDGPYAAVIPRWILALLNGQQPVINGDGSNSRDFTFVQNVVIANQLAAFVSCQLSVEPTTDRSEAEIPIYRDNRQPTTDNIYNIAFGGRTTLTGLFLAIREELAKTHPQVATIEPIYGPARFGDIPHSLADISRAKETLGYRPTIGIREGIRQTCDFFLKRAICHPRESGDLNPRSNKP